MNTKEAEAHRRKCYHEAAHALVGVNHGAKLLYIIANPPMHPELDGDYVTRLNSWNESAESKFRALQNKAASLFAGSLGDWLSRGSDQMPPWINDRIWTWDGASSDWHIFKGDIESIFPNMSDDLLTLFINGAKSDAWFDLLDNKDALVRLGEALINTPRIEGHDAIEIIKGSRRGTAPKAEEGLNRRNRDLQ